MTDSKLILVSGATGYIAGRLIPRLLEAGYRVRCLARHPQHLRHRRWFLRVECVCADLNDAASLPDALRDVDIAYYLVHSMGAGRGYERLDLRSARNFAQAAQTAGVEHIIYLGALADPSDPQLALHMRSRIETGVALRQFGVPVTEFRAGIIIGPGSISFEMIRFVAEQFPLMVGPNWLRHRSQPIATDNVLDYLLAALHLPPTGQHVLEIGGPDTMTYAEVMSRYARQRGLRRGMLLLPFVPVWFMALLIDRLTPIAYPYAHPLVEGLKNDSLVQNPTSLELFPAIELLDYTEAVRRSLADLHPDRLERVWLDAGRAALQVKHEGFFVDYRFVESQASAESIFQRLCAMGGTHGWPVWTDLWRLRGRIDRLLGGPGLRGRPETLRAGDVLDFYRIEGLSAPHFDADGGPRPGLLRLRTELRTPGAGWMEWQVTPRPGGCILEQTAFFAPKGLGGFLYWYLLAPFHRAVFRRLLAALAQTHETTR